jgi:hypothetical protein
MQRHHCRRECAKIIGRKRREREEREIDREEREKR